MKKHFVFLFVLHSLMAKSQESNASQFSITPEILVGATTKSNFNFPSRKLQKQAYLSFGWHHRADKQHWFSYLKTSKAGISIGYTDLGNQADLGEFFVLQPFLEYRLLKSHRLNLHIGTGISYVTQKYHPVTNKYNRAVSTDLNWAFRLFAYYNLILTPYARWRIGLGYAHHSNGHARLPNQGYNSFLGSLSSEIGLSRKKQESKNGAPVVKLGKTISHYFSVRSGYGWHVLSQAFDERKGVYTLSGEFGKIYNHTLKLGIGSYVRFYQGYYDYISNNESLVQEGREFASLRSDAFANALNVGVTGNSELLLNHVGIDLQVGINLYKPAYKIDWRINQGWGEVPRKIPENGGFFRLGDLDDDYYKIKRTISIRYGLKYYFVGTVKKPIHNFFAGIFINSNLGQADFTEVAIGYQKMFRVK